MKVVIVGDGKIGSTLAEQLTKEGQDVTIIDSSAEPLEKTAADFDILCVEGNGATTSVQLEAGVDTADLMIAVTNSDELNLLCCLIAKKLGAKHTVARVRNPEYFGEIQYISDDLGLSFTVNPERGCANDMARAIRIPSAIKADVFAKGRVELFKFQLPSGSALVGRTLMELPGIVKAKVLVCAVERGDDEVYTPSGSFRLKAGDYVSFVASHGDARQFFTELNLYKKKVKSVLIVGAGRIAYYFAKNLLDSGIKVKIVDKDRAQCEQISIQLPTAQVFCGDGTSEDFLEETGIESVDAFAALTGIDEENVLMSMYVRKKYPDIKVLTKIKRDSFRNIIETLDLGSVFDPRISVSNLICSYVRSLNDTSGGSKVETLYKLVGGKVEALEFKVSESSAVCGIPLMELNTKEGVLIGCIIRGDQIIFPRGKDSILPGDTVIVVTTITGFDVLDDIVAE